MDYFKEEISSSGKPYYRNKITNETQLGFQQLNIILQK